MTFSYRYSLFLHCLLGLVSGSLHATTTVPQTPPDPGAAPQELEPVEVCATAAPSLTLAAADAARAEIGATPGGVDLVASDAFRRGRSSTLADTFAYSPGVVAQPRFGADEARLSIRGSGLQRTFHGRGIRVSQDGVPINLADGGFDMQTLEPLATDYIRVWRGGNALGAGASTLGGAIDYTSFTGHSGPALGGRVEAGSFGYLRANAAAGGVAGAWDGYASLTYAGQDGFRDHAVQDALRFFGNGAWRLSPVAESRLFLTTVVARSELPGNLTRAELETDPRQADANAVTRDTRRDYDLVRVADKTSWVGADGRLDLTGAWTYKDLDHPLTFGVIDQRSNDLWLGADGQWRGALGAWDQALRGGLSLQHGTIAAATFANLDGARGAPLSAADQTATNLEAYLAHRSFLGAGWSLELGATAAHNVRESETLLGSGASYAVDYDNLSPKLGLLWEGAELQVFTNLSWSYEPPSFSETLTTPAPNEAQTAVTGEIGTRGQRGFARWDAVLYASRLEGELLSISPGQVPQTVNADRTTHAGLELGGALDLLGGFWSETPADRLVLRGAWTYGRFRFDDDPAYGDNTLAGLPPHLLRAELLWEHGAWYVGPTVEWVPEGAFIDFANTLQSDGYALLGFKTGYRSAGRGWGGFVEVRNLFDEVHAATTGVIRNAGGNDQRQFLPGDGQAFYAGLEYAW